jgi:hypothetical protein
MHNTTCPINMINQTQSNQQDNSRNHMQNITQMCNNLQPLPTCTNMPRHVYKSCVKNTHKYVPTSPYHTPYVYSNSSTKCLIHVPKMYINQMSRYSTSRPLTIHHTTINPYIKPCAKTSTTICPNMYLQA